MDTAVVCAARVFVDSRTAAFAEAGDILIPIGEGAITREHVLGELGEVAAGRIAGRAATDDITIFKSLGMAVEDMAAAHLVFGRAVERGIGTMIP
jgi:ornithine cyclodeaminase